MFSFSSRTSCLYAASLLLLCHVSMSMGGTFMNPQHCDCIPCAKDCRPVCGSNGVTYANMCVFVSSKCKDDTLAVAYEGPCQQQEENTSKCDPSCHDIYQPVCGSDNLTYDNMCTFKYAACLNPNLFLLRTGPCTPPDQNKEVLPPFDPCDLPCAREYIPVCGSDHVTYPNACMFKNARCKTPTLHVLHTGSCTLVRSLRQRAS